MYKTCVGQSHFWQGVLSAWGGRGLVVMDILQDIRAGYRDVHMTFKIGTREGYVACHNTLDEADKLEQKVCWARSIHMEQQPGMLRATVVEL